MSFGTREQAAARTLIELGLAEDLGDAGNRPGDITSCALISPDAHGRVAIVARAPGIIAGLPVAALVFEMLDPSVAFRPACRDGDRIAAGCAVAEVSGAVRSLLIGERTALNFLTHLAGIATLTRQFVEAVSGTRAAIYDTRKTLPGWRLLEKYAVRAAGGKNHRLGLYDMVLIKDNHLAAWLAGGTNRTIAGAVRAARGSVPAERATAMKIEVEVDSLAQLADALEGEPDLVLLDNMTCQQMRQAVALRDARSAKVELEASGGVSLNSVTDIAQTGVERISVGALTHSVCALDLAFDWRP
jgi:nicotinate-nucleotide pyrophosphorylase (carboxylating)